MMMLMLMTMMMMSSFAPSPGVQQLHPVLQVDHLPPVPGGQLHGRPDRLHVRVLRPRALRDVHSQLDRAERDRHLPGLRVVPVSVLSVVQRWYRPRARADGGGSAAGRDSVPAGRFGAGSWRGRDGGEAEVSVDGRFWLTEEGSGREGGWRGRGVGCVLKRGHGERPARSRWAELTVRYCSVKWMN